MEDRILGMMVAVGLLALAGGYLALYRPRPLDRWAVGWLLSRPDVYDQYAARWLIARGWYLQPPGESDCRFCPVPVEGCDRCVEAVKGGTL